MRYKKFNLEKKNSGKIGLPIGSLLATCLIFAAIFLGSYGSDAIAAINSNGDRDSNVDGALKPYGFPFISNPRIPASAGKSSAGIFLPFVDTLAHAEESSPPLPDLTTPQYQDSLEAEIVPFASDPDFVYQDFIQEPLVQEPSIFNILAETLNPGEAQIIPQETPGQGTIKTAPEGSLTVLAEPMLRFAPSPGEKPAAAVAD